MGEQGHPAKRPVLIIVDGQVRAEAWPDPGGRARPHMFDRPVQPIPVGQGEEVRAGTCRLVDEDLGHGHAIVRGVCGGNVEVREALSHPYLQPLLSNVYSIWGV